MYTLARMTRPMMTRRPAACWQPRDEFFRSFADMMNVSMRTNVKETDEAYMFEAELPGYESGEIELMLQDGVMTITAEHKEGEGDEAVTTRSVRRSFTVEGIDEENIGAQYKNGILRVTLPKEKVPEAEQPRKIAIEG